MKKLLIVVDMQKDFVDGALGTCEAVEIVDGVAEKIKSFDGDIIVTYDTHPENYLETSEGKALPVPHCIRGTAGWELDKKVQNALSGKEYRIFEKPTFGSTDMAEYVKKSYCENVEILLVGLCTDICVVSNALLLKATLPDAKICVDASCCAGVTPDNHNAALAVMQACQIKVIGK